MKSVVYYCPGCRQRIIRELPRSVERYPSFCVTAGRAISMRRIVDQDKALRKLMGKARVAAAHVGKESEIPW